MLHGHGLLVLIDVLNRFVGEQVDHWMIDAVELTVPDFDSRERAHDALRHRPQVMRDVGLIGRIVGIEHDLAVTNDQQTVLRIGSNGFHQPSQRAGLHPLLFGSRNGPRLGRPCRFPRFCFRCKPDRGDQTLKPAKERNDDCCREPHPYFLHMTGTKV